MSWLAKSLANSFIPDDSDGSDEEEQQHSLPTDKHSDQGLRHRQQPPQPSRQSILSEKESPPAEDAAAGVKEDLSELTKTLTRQFWGVASFLAPPPPPPAPSSAVRSEEPDSNCLISHCSSESQDLGYDSAGTPTISGIRSDFAEIGGKFRSGMSRISGNKAVTEISKIASSFLPFGSDGKDLVGGAIGVTDEVLAFARNIAMHPETWLDFPLFVDDDYTDDTVREGSAWV
ncbi:hypothetical protein ACLOJK_036046 [Asimina triloba]